MIYNNVLLLVLSFFNVMGTIYSVLSIIKINPQDIFHSITWGGIGDRDKEILIQVKQARIGISIVLISWIFEVVFTFYEITSLCSFILSLLITLLIIFCVVLIAFLFNKHSEKVYQKFKEENQQKN
jgi:purine-cytosine permease-like protein